MISFQTDSEHDTPSQIRRSRIKIIFLLDITNDKSEITVPNGRALEVLSLPHQLQLETDRTRRKHGLPSLWMKEDTTPSPTVVCRW